MKLSKLITELLLAFLFLFTVVLLTDCKKDDGDDLPASNAERRIKTIKVFTNDTLFMIKTVAYDDQNRLIEIVADYIEPYNTPIPITKKVFNYVSDQLIESTYYGYIENVGWQEDCRYTRKYMDGKLIEYWGNYTTDMKAFYSYNQYGLSKTKYLSLPFKDSDTCVIEEYLYDDHGLFAGADFYFNCKGSDSADRKIRYVRNEQQQIAEIQHYAWYWSGYWEMSAKLTFDYYQNGRIEECMNYKFYSKNLSPITKFNFEYNSDGTLKRLIYTELYTSDTETYILSYENGKGNFHELRTLYNYASYRYWMPDINISGHFPFYY